MRAFTVASVSQVALRALNYSPVADRLRRSPRRTMPLADCVTNLGDSSSRVSRVECASAFGVRMLGQTDTYAIEPQGKWIRAPENNDLAKLTIRRGDILIAGAGQVGETTLFGRPVIADSRLVNCILGGDTLALTPKSPRIGALLFAYLLSPTGRDLLVSTAYGTSIPRIHLGLVGALPVPVCDEKTLDVIVEQTSAAVQAREEYAVRISGAREVIERREEMQTALVECRTRELRTRMWTDALLGSLGAWNYISAGQALATLRDVWRGRLADWLEPDGWYYGLLRQRTECAPHHGAPLITQRDALSIRPLPTWIAIPGMPRRSLFSEPGTIVMAGRGTLGENELFARPAAITPYLSRFALTQDLVRVVPKHEWRGPAFAYLSTMVGRRLLRTAAVGTKILQLRKDLQLKLPVPNLTSAEVATINDHYDAAVLAFDRALLAEDRLQHIIEKKVLPKWLA